MDRRGEPVVCELLRAGRKVRFRAHGTSMLGAIWPGDVIEVEPLCRRPLSLGDIALYERQGRLIAHRVVGIVPDHPGGPRWLVRGDNLAAYDLPVAPGEILGRVRRVQGRLPFLVRSHLSRFLHRLRDVRPMRLLLGSGHVGR